MRFVRPLPLSLILTSLLVLASLALHAQDSSGTLRGRVTDPSGAVIPQASVTATSDKGSKATAVTNSLGVYEIKALAPGNYSVSAVAKGFSVYTESNVTVTAGQVQQFDLALGIDVPQEKINVEEQPATVSVSPSENASAIVIKGKDLDALSDDPDELQSELEALAGPSAGPSGGQIYIDGFTAGQLPPKSAIREIRINQDPFSSQYDKLGYGRIEIFTKPGTDKFHGQILVDGNDSAFNSQSPFVTQEPPYHSEFVTGSLSGPISKKASFFIDGTRRDISDASIVNATILDPEDNPIPFQQAFPTTRTRTELNPRADFQLSKNNTLTVRYQYYLDNENNQGIGQFSLPSQSFNSSSTEHTLQLSDTQVVSTNVVNETRFQFIRELDSQNVQSFAPTLSVLGAFTGGGNSQGNSSDSQNHYELQNYTSVLHGNHFIKFGGRLRASTDSNTSVSGFNGEFTFSSLSAYQNQLNGLCPSGPTPSCGPSQFSIISGEPLSEVTYVDVGLYGSDDWKIRPNMTLSYGLRYETQNNIGDHGDIAPRISFAWGLDGGKKAAPKTVLRTGFGIFYDRVGSNLVLQSERLNGVTQLQTIVANPNFFPNVPTSIPGGQTSPTIYQFAPGLRAPYTVQSALSLERQITKKITASVTYLNSLGDHQLFLRNANAPLPDGSRPFGGTTNIYQYDSEGVFRQNQLIANFRVNLTKISLFGFYTLSYANSDLGTSASSAGASFFPGGGGSTTPNFLTHQYDPIADYGRAGFDVRDRVFLGGTITLPYAFRLSPFIVISSGAPFNITVGQDLNGDSIFNDRPSLASAATCPTKTLVATNVFCTPYGTFNTLPGNAQAIPINSETGPPLASVNLRLSKTIGFGKEVKGGGASGGYGGGPGGRGGGAPGGGLSGRGLTGGGGGGGPFSAAANTNHRYNVTFTVSGRNIFNRINLAAPVGNLDSPFFGQSTGLAGAPYSSGAASRRIDLQAMFSF